MYICTYIRITHIYPFIMHICMYIYTNLYLHVSMHTHKCESYIYVYTLYTCIYIFMYINLHIYIYTYMCTQQQAKRVQSSDEET